MRLFLLAFVLPGFVFAQPAPDTTAHRVPFASAGNALELAVANTGTDEALEGVTVRLTSRPEWLAVSPEAVVLEALAPSAEATASFAFDVDRKAPVGEPAEVAFTIESADGRVWAKVLRLAVEAPRQLALAPAYPNPFGRQATLAFELPEASRVTLAVYDVLGREVARLVEGERAPGRHEAALDARLLASGLYVARLLAETPDGRRTTRTRRMTVVR